PRLKSLISLPKLSPFLVLDRLQPFVLPPRITKSLLFHVPTFYLCETTLAAYQRRHLSAASSSQRLDPLAERYGCQRRSTMSSAPVDASAFDAASMPQKRFSNLRSVRWRIDLGVLPSSPPASIDDIRRVTADTRRRYANLRRRLLIDHHSPKNAKASPDLTVDNPLSQNPALAVSMLLYVRSSLLATETATTCLQRLLSFPQNPDMKKLIEKAKSLQVLALESNLLSSSCQTYSNRNQLTISRGYSLPSATALPKTSFNVIPDRYWEEQWRVLHKNEELRKQSNGHSSSSGIMKKIFTERLSLSRTNSEPFEGNNAHALSSVRRRLFGDSSQVIVAAKDHAKSECNESPVISNELNVGKGFPEELADQRTSNCMVEETLLSGHNALVVSAPPSPHDIGNDHENESEKSSITSNSFLGDNDEETISMEESCSQNKQDEESTNMEGPCCQNLDNQLAQDAEATSSGDVDSIPEQTAVPKDRKPSAGKFQWLWRFGRGSKEENQESKRSPNAGHIEKDSFDISHCDGNYKSCGINKRIEVGDKKVMETIRNLGQSMLEHIQVIETVFQQDKSKFDSLDNLSNNILGGKGQGTAIAALKELRKISSLFREM
ncbi:hypothetical protein BHE74_00053454, partial [Ensete ventricosum]